MDTKNQKIFSARQGYNFLAAEYEKWKWYPFWRANEGPLIKRWLETVNNGVGLDAGCGNAPYLSDYGSLKSRKILVDFSEGMLAIANKQLIKYYRNNPIAKDSFSIIQADIQFVPIQNQEIDFILCSRVLSNIKDFRAVFREFSRLLKPSGKLLITDIHPNHNYEFTGIDTKDGRINIETYKHELKEILDFAPQVDLKITEHKEYNFFDLIKPPEKRGFEKIYASPIKQIFYTLQFTKL